MKDSVSVSLVGNGGVEPPSEEDKPPTPVTTTSVSSSSPHCNGSKGGGGGSTNGNNNGPSHTDTQASVSVGNNNKCSTRTSPSPKPFPFPPPPVLFSRKAKTNGNGTISSSSSSSAPSSQQTSTIVDKGPTKPPTLTMTINGNSNVRVTVTGTSSASSSSASSTSSSSSSSSSTERERDNSVEPQSPDSVVNNERNNDKSGGVSGSGSSGGGDNVIDGNEGEIIDPDTNYDSDDDQPIPGLSPKGGVMHCRIVTAFTKAFAKQNVHFEKAIQSLDTLNEQIISFVFSSDTEALARDGKNGEAKYTEAFKVSIALMRRLLLDVQGKFRKMVEENKALAGKIDGDLQSAHRQMALLRAELSDTNKRISQLSSPPSSPSTPNHHDGGGGGGGSTTSMTTTTNNNCLSTVKDGTNNETHNNKGQVNGIQSNNNGLSNHADLEFIDSTSTVDLEGLSSPELRAECDKLLLQNGNLRRELVELRKGGGGGGGVGGKGTELTTQELQTELQQAGNILKAMKADRKRLKAEKFELLNQMKQLYATLEDKEKELRDFIRNYEQRMRESEASLQRLAIERDEAEREKWNILRHARDEAERGLALATQLNVREVQVQQMQEELHEAKRQLAQYGIYSEPDRSSSTNATSHYSLVSSLTATYATVGDRGSSADSGVRLSSDRDSGAGLPTASNLSDSANEAISLDLCGGDGSGDGDSMSVISTATLPQLFATPRDSPGPLSYSNFTRSMDANALSRSAEQLLAAEAAECRRKSGRRTAADLTGRASAGAKGAWGSISRVFARNKHRRTLDPSSLYTGQRSSWSPQSSVPASPSESLYDKSYGDKLRALEEAATLPMELWRASMVQAWIEIGIGMPQYGSRCADNIKSGKVLLELSNEELESELGIAHPLHRKKLRLAIEEHRNPALVRFPCTVELSHIWVSSEWLPDIGLPQYADNFAGCLVDARLLDHLSKKDLEKYLGVTRKFHLAAIAHGVHLLRIVAYDRQSLAERRRQCDNDPLVWTNQHFIQWARSIDLNEYADNLKGSGVHGAFAVLEPSFNGDTLASAMGVSPSKQIIRRHLTAELDALLNPARAKITQQYRVTKSRPMPPSSTPPAPAPGTPGSRPGDPVGLLSDKQRSDSLGRTSTLTNDFRRSSDDTRRRTSLRTYSLLFAQKGSLSRALGLKMKQDLLHRRQEEKEKSEDREREFLGAISMLGPPPPLPPGLPGKLSSSSTSNNSSTNNTNGSLSSHSHSLGGGIGDQPLVDDFTSSILLHAAKLSSHYQSPQSSSSSRPQSVLGGGQSSSGSRQLLHQDVDRDNNDGSSNSNGGNSDRDRDRNDDGGGSGGNMDTDKSSSGSVASSTNNSAAADALKKHRRVKSISEVDHIPVHTPV